MLQQGRKDVDGPYLRRSENRTKHKRIEMKVGSLHKTRLRREQEEDYSPLSYSFARAGPLNNG